VITFSTWFIGRVVFNIDFSTFPEWATFN